MNEDSMTPFFSGWKIFDSTSHLRLHIDGADDVIEVWSCHSSPSVHSDTTFTITVGIQQGTLDIENRIWGHIFLHVNLYGKGLILMAIGNNQQILSTDKEMSIKFGDFPTSWDTNSHHSFPTHIASEHMHQLWLELLLSWKNILEIWKYWHAKSSNHWHLACFFDAWQASYTAGVDVELRIVMDIATGILCKWANRCQIHIRLGSHEELHRNLGRSEVLQAISMADQGIGHEKTFILLSSNFTIDHLWINDIYIHFIIHSYPFTFWSRYLNSAVFQLASPWLWQNLPFLKPTCGPWPGLCSHRFLSRTHGFQWYPQHIQRTHGKKLGQGTRRPQQFHFTICAQQPGNLINFYCFDLLLYIPLHHVKSIYTTSRTYRYSVIYTPGVSKVPLFLGSFWKNGIFLRKYSSI